MNTKRQQRCLIDGVGSTLPINENLNASDE